MTLLEANKHARRVRILETARALLEKHGYKGVTMRALAEASQVSVPTLYNLFGGREQVLLAAVEERFAEVLSTGTDASAESSVTSLLALFAAMNGQLVEAPRYSRTMIQVFMGASGTRSTSMRMARTMAERLTLLLLQLKQKGVLAAWVDPLALAQRLGSHYLASVIAWAATRQSAEALRACTEYELGLCLLGAVAHKRDRELVHARVLAAQPLVSQAALELASREKGSQKARAK